MNIITGMSRTQNQQTPGPKKNPDSKTILVIDDDRPTCLYFKTLLEFDGLHVETAFGGEEALNLLKSEAHQQFDLVILDLMMPGYGGYEVLKELQQPGYQDVPIFIETAHVLDQATVDLINSESNVHGYWTKPIDTKEFKTKIHELLGTAPKEKQ